MEADRQRADYQTGDGQEDQVAQVSTIHHCRSVVISALEFVNEKQKLLTCQKN